MAKFKIITPSADSFTVPGASCELEMEALQGLDVDIVEVPAGSEDAFVAAARDADALYAKGMPITKRIIDGLERCRIIALGTVGVDSVDVTAATARGIPVTNVPDTFIEEVADHAMTLLLATFRHLVEQDRMRLRAFCCCATATAVRKVSSAGAGFVRSRLSKISPRTQWVSASHQRWPVRSVRATA
jgi:D-3-phosphoglycerate dehydrogenase